MRTRKGSPALVALLVILLTSVAESQTAPIKPDPPKDDYSTRIGLITPRVNLIGGGGSVSQETTSLRKSISSFLTGPRMETVDLRAKLDSLALEESKERNCDYVLSITLTRKRQTTTKGSGVSYGGGTKAGDEFVFEYKLVATDEKQQPITKVLKATASADGDDVLTPMIETTAQAIVGLARSAKPAPPPVTAETKVNTVPSPQATSSEKVISDPVPAGYGSLSATPKRTGPAITKDPPKAEGTIRIGIVTPRVTMTGMGGGNEAGSLRSTMSSYFSGSTIETIDLKARLDSLALSEGQKRECDFVLYLTFNRTRSSSSSRGGPLSSVVGEMGGGVGTKIPGTKTAKDVTSEAARVGSTISALTRANDEITFEYKLVTIVGAHPVVANKTKAKVKKDGEDVLTPMLENAAQAILDAAVKK